MKTLSKLFMFLLIPAILVSCNQPASDRAAEISERLEPGEKPEDAIVKQVEPAQSSVAWEATKITGSHNGTLGLEAGELYVVDNRLVGGNMVLDMTQIVVLDLTDPATNERLTNHLKSVDFFSSETHPQGLFQMAQIKKIENAAQDQPNYTISGNLTIKGITHGISFPAYVQIADGKLTARADFDLDRTLWDVRFRSGRFYENLGDNLIHDNFNIKLDIAAM
jgi:hypothetical protein